MRILKAAAVVLLIVASLTAAASLWKKAFPVAAIDFAVPRQSVPPRMNAFLTALGWKTAGYQSAITFGESDEEKNFVEREYGTSQLERMNREGLGIWYWTGRWFKPEQHEEFGVWMNPGGTFVGYWHTIDEAAALLSLPVSEARALAEKFLRAFITQHPLDRLTFVADSSEKRTHRTDHTFTWQRKDLSLKDALYEVTVTIQGNTVGGYGEGLQVPEWWTRKFAQERQTNDLCENIAAAAALAIVVTLFVCFILALRRHDVRWRSALPWGWLLVFGAIELGTRINGFPSAMADYETTQNWQAFIAEYGFKTVRDILFTIAGVWLLFVVIEPVYRRGLPGALPFQRMFGANALRQPGVIRALGIGILAAIVSVAYVTLFYVAGSHFGVWCPVDTDAAKTISGWLPWIEPAQVGLSASSTEELLFRVAALLLIWKLVRVRWIAVALSAAVWGFLHSNYPQMPGYVRGIELTIVGVAWGILFLRYGLITTLTAHYLYDCWLGSIVVFASGSPANRVGAAIVSLWPIAFFLWAWLRKRAPLEEEIEIGGPAALALPVEDRSWPSFPEVRLSRRATVAIVLFCFAAIAGMTCIPQRQAPLQKLGALDWSRAAIAKRADEVVRSHGYDPSQFQRIVTSSAYGIPSASYLLEHGSLAEVTRLFTNEWPDVIWSVRYFRFLQPEEFRLFFDKSGNLFRWTHDVPKESPGAQLTREEALKIAKTNLEREHRIDLQREDSAGNEVTQRARRRDHQFVFERRNFGWGEAKLRTAVAVQGDEPVDFSRWLVPPEKWVRDHARSGWQKLVKGEVQSWTGLAQVAFICVLVVTLIGRHLIPWRLAFLLGLYAPLLSLLEILNRLPWFFAGYRTTSTVGHYLFQSLVGDAIRLVIGYLAAVLLIGVALGMLRWAFGFRLDSQIWWPSEPSQRKRFLLQTAFLAFASAIALTFSSFLIATVKGYLVPAEAAYFSSWTIDESQPWISTLIDAIQSGISGILRLGIVAGIVGLIARRFPRGVWALIFAYPLLGASGEPTWPEFWLHLGFSEFQLLLTVVLVVGVWRFNIALIFLTYALTSLFSSLDILWFKGGPFYQWQVIPVLGACLGLAAIVVACHLKSARISVVSPRSGP